VSDISTNEILRNLVARLSYARDERRTDLIDELVCEDVLFVIHHPAETIRHEGRETFRTVYGSPSVGRHILSSTDIVSTGPDLGMTMSNVVQVSPDGRVVGLARYDDEFRLEEGGWRLAVRNAHVFGRASTT